MPETGKRPLDKTIFFWRADRAGLPVLNSGNGETKGNGGDQMVSMWWVLVAFFGGGCAGMLVMALMTIAGGLPEPSVPRIDLSEMPNQ